VHAHTGEGAQGPWQHHLRSRAGPTSTAGTTGVAGGRWRGVLCKGCGPDGKRRSYEVRGRTKQDVTDCLAVIDALAVLIERIDGELHQHAKAGPRVKVLRTLPGVGEFTALVMVAEIGDITRFPSARKLASWSRLTPTVRGSDLKVRHGHISKMVCAGGMVPLRRPGGVRWRSLEDSICTGVS